MNLKERMETVKGLKLGYEVQGYLSTNDADFLLETFDQMEKVIEELNKHNEVLILENLELKNKVKKANESRYNLGEGM